ncbi:unnamed protein product [Leuciscus chuanchicus]
MPRKYAYQRSWLHIQGLWSIPDATSQEVPSATESRPSTWGANLTHTQPKQQAGAGKRGDEGEEGAVRSLARKRGIFFSVIPEGRRYIALSNPQEQLIHTMSPFMFLPPTPKMAVIRSGSSVQCAEEIAKTCEPESVCNPIPIQPGSWVPPSAECAKKKGTCMCVCVQSEGKGHGLILSRLSPRIPSESLSKLQQNADSRGRKAQLSGVIKPTSDMWKRHRDLESSQERI